MSSLLLVSVIYFVGLGSDIIKETISKDSSYSLTLNSADQILSGAKTGLDNDVYFLSNGISGEKITLANNGYFHNQNKIKGINRISVSLFTGSVQIWYGQYTDNDHHWISYTSSTTYDLSDISPNYFKIVASSETIINSVTIDYSCEDTYIDLDMTSDYSVYINGEKQEGLIDVTSLKKEGETWTKQFKLITDVYVGDVLSFKKANNYIDVDASGDGNNLRVLSNGFRVVNSTKEDASLFLKVYPSSYDVWLTGIEGYEPINPIQNAPILQAWNWSATTVKNNLNNIANAGYKAVQLSPMQVQKSYYSGGGVWQNEWWKLYQPVSFSIATGNGNSKSAIGTKNDLISLCNEAKNYDIDIIVDVVANHLGGDSYNSFDSLVWSFEYDIANGGLHHNIGYTTNDDSIEGNTRFTLGSYPDLQTESDVVQRRVLSLLKEYLDCGVTGFRFDAAKHIETPYDSSYASDFWPTVINGAKRYAKEKGYKTPYSYGEILYLNTYHRNYSYYSPFMSATESSQAYDVRRAVYYKSDEYLTSSYLNGVGASKSVLWAESHDIVKSSYDGAGDINALNETQVNQAYAIQASRSDTAVLYVARPYDGSTIMGNVGNTYYKDTVVSAANEFHNRYVGHGEYVDIKDGCFINRRSSGGTMGAMIVNITDYGSLTVHTGLNSGKYLDLVSKNYIDVNSDGTAYIEFQDKVCALVPESIPECYVVGNTNFTGTSSSWGFDSGVAMSLTSSNYGEVENVTINEGSVIKIYDRGRDLWFGYDQLGSTYAFASRNGDDDIALTSGVYNFYLNSNGEIYIVKLSTDEPVVVTFNVTNMPNWIGNDNCDLYAWTWGGHQEARWVKLSYSGTSGTFEEYNDITGFKLIRIANGASPSWNCFNSTGDIQVVSGVYTYSASTWYSGS